MFALKKSRVLLWLPLLLALAYPAAAQTTLRRPNTAADTAAARAATDPSLGSMIPSDAVWFLATDVKRFVENPLGQQLLSLLEKAIREETDDFDVMLDLKTARAKLGKVIGFDPLEGIGSVEMYGLVSPFGGEIRSEDDIVEKMATTGVAVVRLTGGTGNLEGLALATQEYQSTEYNGATIHSGTLPDFPPRVYMAVLKRGEGKPNVVVLGLREEQVKEALDRVKGKPASGQTDSPGASPGGAPETPLVPAPKGTFFAAGLKLDEATIRALGVPQQQSAVFKMLTRVVLSVGADDESVSVQLTAHLVNQQRAEQVRQLVEGAVALVELLVELPIEELKEEELQMLREILKDVDVQVSCKGTQVTCRLTKPADTLFEDLFRAWTGQWEVGRQQDIAIDRARATMLRGKLETEALRKAAADAAAGDADKKALDRASGRR